MSWKNLPGVHRLLLPVLGTLILLVSVGLSALNEKAQIDYQANLQRHGGDLLDLGSDGHPGTGQQGYMVRVVGPLQVVQSPLDTQFNQQSSEPVLIRHVQMFEWREMRYGSPPIYELDWVDHPIDAQHFEHPAGHENPDKFPIDNAHFDAGEVRVNGFVLSPTLVNALPGSQPVIPDIRSLPSNLAATFSLYKDALVTSGDPASPRLGDVRVSWEAVPAQTITVVAKLDGNQLVPAADAADGTGYALQVGDTPLTDIFPDLPLPPDFLWVRRIFSLLFSALGAALLLHWHYRRVDPALTAGTALLIVGAVDALLWLGHGFGWACGWIMVALVGAALIVWRVYKRAAVEQPVDL